LYGKKLPNKGLKAVSARKYFDSGDYALSKAGRAPQSTVGTAIPVPENIPHASNPGNGLSNGHQATSISPTNSTSPVGKESGLANNENTQVPEDEQFSGVGTTTNGRQVISISPTKTSPVGKESDLANNENTQVPEDEQNIPHALSSGNGHSNGYENTEVLGDEQSSGVETVVDETTTTPKNKATTAETAVVTV